MTRHFLKSLGKDSARRINQDLKASVRLVQVGQKNSPVQRGLGRRRVCFGEPGANQHKSGSRLLLSHFELPITIHLFYLTADKIYCPVILFLFTGLFLIAAGELTHPSE